jgi:hypothetical protein
MEDFTNQERSLFLRFVWGRTRLPRTIADFRGRDFVIQILDKYNPPDHFLPESYTCFFLLKMPRYSCKVSNVKVQKKKKPVLTSWWASYNMWCTYTVQKSRTKWLPLPHEVVTKKTLLPNEKTAIKTLSINIDKCELSNVKFRNLEEDLCIQGFRK